MLDTELLNAKIITGRKGAINTISTLTDSNIRGIEMAQSSLPDNPTSNKICVIPDCGKFCKNGKGRLCSMHYRRRSLYGDPNKVRIIIGNPEIRFWAKVDKTPGHGPQGDCWVWTAAKFSKKEYGSFCVNRRTVQAHRYSWFLHTGEWPTLYVLHSCDTPSCVNPGHLKIGTAQDNMDDKVNRNRQTFGESVGISKLKEQDIRVIRNLTDAGWSDNAIARKFHVSGRTVGHIRKRKTWKHVE